MKSKKYRLTNKTKIETSGKTLFQIEALRDFGLVRKGDRGGFVESEDNLSHDGECWIGSLSCVFDRARVTDNAEIRCRVELHDNVQIGGNAVLAGPTQLSGDLKITSQDGGFGMPIEGIETASSVLDSGNEATNPFEGLEAGDPYSAAP